MSFLKGASYTERTRVVWMTGVAGIAVVLIAMTGLRCLGTSCHTAW
jgi:hypothetical protein